MRALTALLIAVSLAAPAASASTGPTCTDESRDCKIATAYTYLNALITHDVDSIRLAPDATRYNNGSVDSTNEAEIRSAVGVEPVARHFNFRWTVEGDVATAIYDLDADLTRLGQSATFLPSPTWLATYIVERFTVRQGLIHHIEVIFPDSAYPTFVDRVERPYRPQGYGFTGPTLDTRATAQTWIDALASHDASALPLAPDAWWVETGRRIADNAEQIRVAAASPERTIDGAPTNIRWSVEGDQAQVWYDVSQATGTTKLSSTRFRVQDGLIKEIETVYATRGTPAERPSD